MLNYQWNASATVDDIIRVQISRWTAFRALKTRA